VCCGSRNKYSSCPECGNLLKSFAGTTKAEFTSANPIFLMVISSMELAMLCTRDCFKLMHQKGE